MRKIITLTALTLLFAFNKGISQLSVGMHVGGGEKSAVIGLHSQFQFLNGFTAGLNLTGHTDSQSPVYMQTRFGYALGDKDGFTVQPYGGYSYWLQSMDQKIYGTNFTKGIQFRYHLNEVASIYADFNSPADKAFLVTIGIAGRFPRK